MSDGARISAYELAGDPNAPPVLFGHGCGFAAGTCLTFLASLRRLRVFAFDTRGHGGSSVDDPAAPEACSVSTLADDLAAVGEFVAETCGRKPYYVGHSMSGSIALWLLAHGDASMFSGFTLFDPAALPPPGHAAHAGAQRKHGLLIARCARRRPAWKTREEYAAALSGSGAFGLWSEAMIADHVRATTKPSVDGGIELCCAPKIEAAILKALGTSEIWEALPHIHRPVHLVSADPALDDCEWVTRCMPDVAARLADTTMKTLPGTHHISMFGRIEECRALVELHCAGAQDAACNS
jgi:pimeloyl-ACP methyl ester carboxylesterase